MNKKYDIIYAPIITEKSAMMANENKYAFKVDPRANKVEIKKAIEEIFEVKVVAVRTVNVHRKAKRVSKYEADFEPEAKEAAEIANIITIASNNIEIFDFFIFYATSY